MIEIFRDEFSIVRASNETLYDSSVDYKEIESLYAKTNADYMGMADPKPPREQFFEKAQVKNPKDATLYAAKNFSLLKAEADARLGGGYLKPFIVDLNDLSGSSQELIESIENTALLRELYKLRKRTTSASGGINNSEAEKLKSCMMQGRELYRSAQTGSMLVKPLSYFYALTAYSYVITVLNNPIRYRKDMLPGSHGVNYLPNDIAIQFGGDIARGTFSDLHSSFPETSLRFHHTEIVAANLDSILSFYQLRFTSSLGTLMSMVPELAEYYYIATGKRSRAHRLTISSEIRLGQHAFVFTIGDGHHRPSRELLDKIFPVSQISEESGRYRISALAADIQSLQITSYIDLHGNLWYIDNPFYPVSLPEVGLHFLALSVFSNVMRYRPDEWAEIVQNSAGMEASLLARHYFSIIERKFNFIILRTVSQFFPFAPESAIWF